MGFLSDLFGLKDKGRAQAAAANAALGNFNLSGPGGMSVGFTPTSANVALGALDPIRSLLLGSVPRYLNASPGTGALENAAASASAGLTGIDPSFLTMLQGLVGQQRGTGAAPNFGATGLPPELLSTLTAAARAQPGSGAAQDFGTAGLPADLTGMLRTLLSGQAGSGSISPEFVSAVRALGTGPDIDPALAAQFGSAASSRLATAGSTADALAADRLRVLREQAALYEQGFIQKSIGDLFARGRFGSNDTLSGKVSEGVSRALSEADLGRQLAAQDLGLRAYSDAVQQALGLSGQSASLYDALFGRQTARAGAEATLFDALQSGRNAELGRATSLLDRLAASSTDAFNSRLAGFQAGQAGRSAEIDRLGSLASLIDSAVGGAYGRNIAGFQAGTDAANSEVGRITSLLSQIPGLANVNSSNAISRFSIAQQLFDSRQNAETASLGRGLSALSGVEGIDASGLNSFMAALQSAVAKSNAAAGQSQIYNQLSQNRPVLDTATGLLGMFF